MTFARVALLALSLALASCVSATGPQQGHSGVEATPYDSRADAAADLADARARAQTDGKLVLAVFGANWCHDSRALAGLLETDRFAALIAANYETVFIDAGVPQEGRGRNLELANALGVDDITGTPTVIVIGRSGATLNAETARSWRNAASRNPDAIYHELLRFSEGGA